MAQSVERILGKDEVTGSIPVSSSKKSPAQMRRAFFILLHILHCGRSQTVSSKEKQGFKPKAQEEGDLSSSFLLI